MSDDLWMETERWLAAHPVPRQEAMRAIVETTLMIRRERGQSHPPGATAAILRALETERPVTAAGFTRIAAREIERMETAMNSTDHELRALKAEHAALERDLAEERARPMPDSLRVREIGKRKLAIKLRLAELERIAPLDAEA